MNKDYQKLNEIELFVDGMWADEHHNEKVGELLKEILNKIEEIKKN